MTAGLTQDTKAEDIEELMDLASLLPLEFGLVELIAHDCCCAKDCAPTFSASQFDLTSLSPPRGASIPKFGVVSVRFDIEDRRNTIALGAPEAKRTQKKIWLWQMA